MSIDTVDELVAAWTADMQDAAKDETAREKWLRERLAAETKRREGIEDELYSERLAHTDAVTRAETAERALRRAEADNAALLAECVRHEASEECRESMNVVTDAAHPGAAPLERLRALEKVREAAEPYRDEVASIFEVHKAPSDAAIAMALLVRHGEALLDAYATVDAMKVPRE